MASIEPTGSEGVSLYGFVPESSETECHEEAVNEGWFQIVDSNVGILRARTEEAIAKAISPNLRKLDTFFETMERIDYLTNLLLWDWEKNEAYLICVENLAPTHFDQAFELAKTMDCGIERAKAFLILSQYKNQSTLLQEAVCSLSPDMSASFLLKLDQTFFKDSSAESLFYSLLHTHLNNLSYYWSLSEHSVSIALADLETRLHMPTANERLKKAHEAMLNATFFPWNMCSLLSLLNTEVRMESQLCGETIAKIHDVIDSHPYSGYYDLNFLANLLAIEARHPCLQTYFEEDFQQILDNFDKRDDFALSYVLSIAPYQLEAAEQLVSRIEGDEKILAWLKCVEIHAQKPKFDLEAHFTLFKEMIEKPFSNIDCLVDVFLEASKIFGAEKVSFLMDQALLDARPKPIDFVEDEIKQASRSMLHYLGEAFGVDYPLPDDTKASQFEDPRFAMLNDEDLTNIAKGLSLYDPSSAKTALKQVYGQLEDSCYVRSETVLDLIRLEFALIDQS